MDELAASGVAELSLEGVARRAGVHKSTLYRRWGNRERLLLDLMREQADQTVRVPDTGSVRQDLIELARGAVANAASPYVQPIIRAVISALPYDPAVAAMAREFWDERMMLDGAIVERGIARGELGPDTDPRSAIEAVLAPLHLRLLITGEPADDLAIMSVVDLVMGGLTSAPGSGRALTSKRGRQKRAC